MRSHGGVDSGWQGGPRSSGCRMMRRSREAEQVTDGGETIRAVATVTLDAGRSGGPGAADDRSAGGAGWRARLAERRAAGEEPLLSATAAAELVGVSPATVRRAIRSGALRGRRLRGWRPRLRRTEVVAWVARGRPRTRGRTSVAAVGARRSTAARGVPASAPGCARVTGGETRPMSVHRMMRRGRSVAWRVRWRDGGRGTKARARTFDRKGDATAFEDELVGAGGWATLACRGVPGDAGRATSLRRGPRRTR